MKYDKGIGAMVCSDAQGGGGCTPHRYEEGCCVCNQECECHMATPYTPLVEA